MIRRIIPFAVIFSILYLAATAVAKESTNARVKGTIQGKNVALTSAEFSAGILEIYEGDNWDTNPSLLIFLFDQKTKVAPGKTLEVSSKTKTNDLLPHLHLRWNGKNGIGMKIVIEDYDLSIHFSEKRKRGYLGAKFSLSIPSEDTNLKGVFFLK